MLFRSVQSYSSFLTLFIDLRLVLPGFPPPNGDFDEKSIFFSESTLTIYEGTLTRVFPTLMCLYLIKILA